MSIEQDIYAEIQQLLSEYRQTLSVDTSDLLTLDRAGAGDAALTRWHEAGQSRFRAGLVPGSDDWRLQRSPNGAEQGYQDVLTVDRATGEVAINGPLSAGALDGVPIGNTTPAPGAFSTVGIEHIVPVFDMRETDSTSSANRVRFVLHDAIWQLQRRTDAGVYVSSDYLIIGDDAGATNHIFKIGNVEAVRIAPTGNLGVGTGSPTEKLDVDGYARAKGFYTAEVLIPNDTAATIPPPSNSGIVMITNQPNHDYPQLDYAGFAMFDAGLSPGIIRLGGGASFYTINGDVTGTTGADPGVTVGVVAGALKIENRFASAMTFRYTIIG